MDTSILAPTLSVMSDTVTSHATKRTPREFYNHLNRFVVGQEKAKRAVAVAAYNHSSRIQAIDGSSASAIRKSNVLLIGPTGSGKTHLARHLATALDVPFTAVDATEFTEAGYYGRDVEQIITELLVASDRDVARCQHGVIFIDEIDKIARRMQTLDNGSGGRDIGGEGVQHALLKLLEGREVFVPNHVKSGWDKDDFTVVDTSNILFICAGTFGRLSGREHRRGMGFDADPKKTPSPELRISHRALNRFGMVEELLGRLPVVVELEPLTDAEMVEILTQTPDSVVGEYQERLAQDRVSVAFNDDAFGPIVQYAQSQGLGARGLRSAVEEVMEDLLFDAPDLGEHSLTIDREFVIARLKDHVHTSHL
jgi:ATP-dependent Clp protease ATP-binding subunit ClpX